MMLHFQFGYLGQNVFISLFFSPVLPSTRRQSGHILGNGRGLEPVHSFFPTSPAIVSSVGGLFEFICAGPLLKKLGFTEEKVAETIDKWILYGGYLCRLFQMNELTLTIPEKARIYHYYIPVFLWCEEQVQRHRSKFNEGDEIPPLVVHTHFLITLLLLSEVNHLFLLLVSISQLSNFKISELVSVLADSSWYWKSELSDSIKYQQYYYEYYI